MCLRIALWICWSIADDIKLYLKYQSNETGLTTSAWGAKQRHIATCLSTYPLCF